MGHLLGGLAILGAALSVVGCGSLIPAPKPAPHYWSLDGAVGSAPTRAAPAAASASAPVLIVAMPRGAAGFDTDRIVYIHEAHRLEPYAENQWIDTTPRMLGPLIAESLARTGVFAAVLTTPSPANAQWELNTEIVRLQHEIAESRVRFTLRATLVDRPLRKVVIAREFDAIAPTPGENPAGAVAAANIAVGKVLAELTDFCTEAVARAR